MRLTVRFVNNFDAVMSQVHAGCYAPPVYRTVQIELTEKQRVKLEKRKIGRNNGHDWFEGREVIALED